VPPQGGRKHPHQDFIQINTANVLFICGGAFQGLDAIVDARVGKGRRTIGFQPAVAEGEHTKTADELLKHVIHDDLLRYGLIPEFVGRSLSCSLQSLDEDSLVRILTSRRTPWHGSYGVFPARQRRTGATEDALEAAAEQALRHKTGARGLRTVLGTACRRDVRDPSRGDVRVSWMPIPSVASGARPHAVRPGAQPLGRGQGRNRLAVSAVALSLFDRRRLISRLFAYAILMPLMASAGWTPCL
jgi:ATP-dependent Clp protease ATP-binding subunit ClpX